MSVIDWSRVSELLEDFGEEEFGELVVVFLEECRDGLEQLKQAASDDADRAAFHFLKGAALNVGFVEIAELCANGETAAANGEDRAEIKSQVASRLPPTCDQFEAEWRQRLSVGS
ncbi:MAG: Hpt domain-containing protein [Roseinatronobacter sp.]